MMTMTMTVTMTMTMKIMMMMVVTMMRHRSGRRHHAAISRLLFLYAKLNPGIRRTCARAKSGRVQPFSTHAHSQTARRGARAFAPSRPVRGSRWKRRGTGRWFLVAHASERCFRCLTPERSGPSDQWVSATSWVDTPSLCAAALPHTFTEPPDTSDWRLY
eukprot:5665758-Pleurochrysis_carterae.AAC.1